jgi:hypothetical protein
VNLFGLSTNDLMKNRVHVDFGHFMAYFAILTDNHKLLSALHHFQFYSPSFDDFKHMILCAGIIYRTNKENIKLQNRKMCWK